MAKIDVATELIQRERAACITILERRRAEELGTAQRWRERGDLVKFEKHRAAAIALGDCADKIELRASQDDD